MPVAAPETMVFSSAMAGQVRAGLFFLRFSPYNVNGTQYQGRCGVRHWQGWVLVVLAGLVCWGNPASIPGIVADGVRRQAVAASGVQGFGILYRLPGLWNGPVTSTTPAGSFPKWYVDFRPTSAGQLSQFSTVKPGLNNYLSFFIVRHGGRLKVAMRTDATFRGKGCITYEVIQSADEERGVYVFADFQSGKSRAYTVFTFTGRMMNMRTFTNKFNKLRAPVLHADWNARLVSRAPALAAVRALGYPRPHAVKDFSTVFGNRHESIYFVRKEAPYPSETEPYVGRIRFLISTGGKVKHRSRDEVLLMLTTRPLYDGFRYLPSRLQYLSKLVYLPGDIREHLMTLVHPGSYYLYAYTDTNGDKRHSAGEYCATRLVHQVTVSPSGTVVVPVMIDGIIP